MAKEKPCNNCGGYRLIGKTICYQCFINNEKIKREQKIVKQKERKKIKRDKNKNSIKYLTKQAWTLMSLVVRLTGADKNGFNICYTCDTRKHYKQLQAGHYWHNKLDFDFRNIKPQCVACNKWRSGNLAVFGTKLAQELGVEGMKQLDKEAHSVVYSWSMLKYIIFNLEEMLKQWK